MTSSYRRGHNKIKPAKKSLSNLPMTITNAPQMASAANMPSGHTQRQSPQASEAAKAEPIAGSTGLGLIPLAVAHALDTAPCNWLQGSQHSTSTATSPSFAQLTFTWLDLLPVAVPVLSGQHAYFLRSAVRSPAPLILPSLPLISKHLALKQSLHNEWTLLQLSVAVPRGSLELIFPLEFAYLSTH